MIKAFFNFCFPIYVFSSLLFFLIFWFFLILWLFLFLVFSFLLYFLWFVRFFNYLSHYYRENVFTCLISIRFQLLWMANFPYFPVCAVRFVTSRSPSYFCKYFTVFGSFMLTRRKKFLSKVNQFGNRYCGLR